MDEGKQSNNLISNSKGSDSRQSVQLHPLVILTISDYITRHTLRQQNGPICGAILGSQNGREVTMEHAFECKTEASHDGEAIMEAGWFHDRLQQYKEVHKTLDFVGWFTLASSAGPEPHHLPIHRQILDNYNESALLLTFHPSSLADGSTRGGKLPLNVYEPVWEIASDDGDKQMQYTGDVPSLALRFRELPYTIETGDAEMIGVDFVAKGGANAAAQANGITSTDAKDTASTKNKGKGKGKSNEAEKQPNGTLSEKQIPLSPEEEESIASFTTKVNAIRMLRQRISLIKLYLNQLPRCYLNDASIHTCEAHPQVSHTILRSIVALLARLPLLTPSTPAPASGRADQQPQPQTSLYAQESAAQAADVALVSLLGALGDTLQSAQQVGKKFTVVDQARSWGRGRYAAESQDSLSESSLRVALS